MDIVSIGQAVSLAKKKMVDSTGRRLDSFEVADASQVVDIVKLRAATLLSRLPAAPPSMALAPSDNQPTVTTASAATITSLYQPYPLSGGQITEVGSRGSWNNSFGRWDVNGSIPGQDFYLLGTTVEIGLNPQTTSTPVWIFVDGQPTTSAPVAYTTTASGAFWLKLVFPTTGRRRVEVFANPIASWYPTRATYDNLITPAPRRPVIAWVGDSFFAGSASASAFQSTPFMASRLLGTECASVSFGGTGYVNAGSFNTFGSASRVAQVARFAPELIVLSGSVNDGTTADGLQAAAAAAFAAYDSAVPGAPLIVFGPQPSNATDTVSSLRATRIGQVAAAAAAAPNVLAFHDMVGTGAGGVAAWSSSVTYNEGDLVTRLGSVWRCTNNNSPVSGSAATPGSSPRWTLVTYAFTGTGRVGSPGSDGTRDTFLYSDGVHPTPEGNAALGLIQIAEIRQDLLLAAA